MTPEDRASRLTAYALNDPGLSAADRQEIEAALMADPAARRGVEETRRIAELLTASLAEEQAAQPAAEPVTIPLVVAKRQRSRGWIAYVAVALLFALFGGSLLGWTLNETMRKASTQYAASYTTAPTDETTIEAALNPTSKQEPRPSTPKTVPVIPSPPGMGIPGGGLAAGETPPGRPGLGGGAGLGGFGGGGLGGFGGGTGGFGGMQGGIGGPPPGGQAAGYPGQPYPGGPGALPPQGLGGYPAPGEHERLQLGMVRGEASLPANDRYPSLVENRFVTVEGQAALSTFGVDVDTASYAIVRKYLTMGQLPPADAVRLEEMVNYFPYQDRAPDGDDPFAVTVEVAECPWAPKHRLARIGLKAKPVATDKRPPSNLVFLIDVSGSMNEPAKLPLVKASLRMLVGQLGENDRVAMVVYAGSTGLVLDSTPATKKEQILAALDRLEAGGSTNGSGGLQQAYAVAGANFLKGGTNRVILCTDGDWNVGTTGTADLVKMIEEKRQTGVFLSVFGFGMGNLRDEMMVKLAGKGNGNYGYIDTPREANKALVEQLGGTLVTVAKDVKVQVEFNPARVKAYRLLGYEKRALAAKDFHDDRKDAGEMGAGHVVTALYELVPAGGVALAAAEPDALRYQRTPAPKPAEATDRAKESFVVKMRHKKPDGDTSTLRELPVTDAGKGYAAASEDFRFASAVAAFAMLLKNSPYKGDGSFALVQELAGAAKTHDPSGYRAEFLDLVKRAKQISGRP